jgi:endoglucanase
MLWLHELAGIPTASGREHRVVAWVERWLRDRPDLASTRDPAGNLHIAFRDRSGSSPGAPLYFTAHLDHPAFVIEEIVNADLLRLSFRGGVMDDYFSGAALRILDGRDRVFRARIEGIADGAPGPHKQWLARLEPDTGTGSLRVGDIGVWDVPDPGIEEGRFHAQACDDLSALAAALSAMDVLRSGPRLDVRLLLTRAEEIGFIGAIAAVRHGTIERGSRVIALENSRSFADSPIHAGPIVRVGDRISVFSPALTDAVATVAERIAGGPASVTASQKLSEAPAWKWQRKLMAGGACEASVFCHAGYECTCVCLPLGNYHNMADLADVQAGSFKGTPRVARECIGVDDYHGLVDLLVACGRSLPERSSLAAKFEKLWEERKGVLDG